MWPRMCKPFDCSKPAGAEGGCCPRARLCVGEAGVSSQLPAHLGLLAEHKNFEDFSIFGSRLTWKRGLRVF